jgi:hypothetical protein
MEKKTMKSESKLRRWAVALPMFFAMLILSVTSTTGCTQAQKINVAQEIVNWTPAFIMTADTVNVAIMALDPPTVVVLGPLTAAINALAPQFELAAKNYLANPNQTTLQVLQALVVQVQQNTNAALLAAVAITNPSSQASAKRNINLVATIVNTLLGLIQSVSTKTQIAAMATVVHVTLAQVRPYMDQAALQAASVRVSQDLALGFQPTPDQFFAAEARAGF